MTVEIKGQQLRIRIKNPRRYNIFRIHDVGIRGRLQRVAGWSKKTGWQTQAWRLNMKDYRDVDEIIAEIKSLNLRRDIEKRAIDKAVKYFHAY